MEFIVGFLCGVGLTMAVQGVWAEFGSATGVEKPKHSKTSATKTWAQTKNFLYYDGTRMPEVKEDVNEQ